MAHPMRLPLLLLALVACGPAFTVREPPPEDASPPPACDHDGEVDNPLWGCWYPPPPEPADAATQSE